MVGGTISPFKKEKYNSPTDYEKKLSSKIKGSKAEIASGAFSGDYDITSKSLMLDAKRTEAKSFSVNIEKFKAIERRSKLDQIPGISVNFSKHNESLVIIRQEDLIGLLNIAYDYNKLNI